MAVARRLQLRKGIVLHGSALVGVGQLLEFVTPVGIFYTWDGIFLILFLSGPERKTEKTEPNPMNRFGLFSFRLKPEINYGFRVWFRWF